MVSTPKPEVLVTTFLYTVGKNVQFLQIMLSISQVNLHKKVPLNSAFYSEEPGIGLDSENNDERNEYLKN